MPSLVDICSLVLREEDENVKRLQTDGRTTGNPKSSFELFAQVS